MSRRAGARLASQGHFPRDKPASAPPFGDDASSDPRFLQSAPGNTPMGSAARALFRPTARLVIDDAIGGSARALLNNLNNGPRPNLEFAARHGDRLNVKEDAYRYRPRRRDARGGDRRIAG
jgi:hypothetical protein